MEIAHIVTGKDAERLKVWQLLPFYLSLISYTQKTKRFHSVRFRQFFAQLLFVSDLIWNIVCCICICFFNPWREFIASLGIHYYVECLHLVLCLTSSRTQTQFFFYFQPDGVISPFTTYCREIPAVAFTINLFTQTRKLKPSALSLTSNCRISQHLFWYCRESGLSSAAMWRIPAILILVWL